jgi:hypothetical protein
MVWEPGPRGQCGTPALGPTLPRESGSAPRHLRGRPVNLPTGRSATMIHRLNVAAEASDLGAM